MEQVIKPPVAFVEQMKRAYDVITLKIAKEIALKVSGAYEGKNPSYSSLGDNFDEQGMSWGIIQYNFGQNILGPLLLKMKSKGEQKFNECFVDSNDLESLNTALAGSIQDQINWAVNMQENPQLVDLAKRNPCNKHHTNPMEFTIKKSYNSWSYLSGF